MFRRATRDPKRLNPINRADQPVPRCDALQSQHTFCACTQHCSRYLAHAVLGLDNSVWGLVYAVVEPSQSTPDININQPSSSSPVRYRPVSCSSWVIPRRATPSANKWWLLPRLTRSLPSYFNQHPPVLCGQTLDHGRVVHHQ